MFITHGYMPELVEQFIRGTDEGASTQPNPTQPTLLVSSLQYHSAFSKIELDALRLRMHVKWHHSWARRIVHPNTPPESVRPAYTVKPLTVPDDAELGYV